MATIITRLGKGLPLTYAEMDANLTNLNTDKAEVSALNAHIADPTDAHAASAITNIPAGNIAATTVQAAINELDTEKTSTVTFNAHLTNPTDAHAASAISNTPAGTIAATDVQAALNELDTEKASLADLASTSTGKGAALIGTDATADTGGGLWTTVQGFLSQVFNLFTRNVDTIAALRLITPTVLKRRVYVRAYATEGDGGHGTFRAVTGAAPGTYVDNGGTIIVPTGGDGSAAWLRDYSGAVNVRWFGAKGDGVTDDTSATQSAINYVALKNASLLFPQGTYNISTTIGYAWASTGVSLHLLGETAGLGTSGSYLKWVGASGGTLWYSTGTNSLVVENIGFNGNLSAGKLFFCDSGVSSSNMQFINCVFSETNRTIKSAGLQIGSGTIQVSEIVIDRCSFQSCYYGLLSFTGNVKNFRILNSNAWYCYWGFAHGNPDVSTSIVGQWLIQGAVFGINGNTVSGFFNSVVGNVGFGGDVWCSDGTIISCESEGSSRFIDSQYIGNNIAILNLIGNHFELSSNVPTDDYVVIGGGGILLTGNIFQNSRTGSSVAKIKALGVANIYTNPTAFTVPFESRGNWYMNATYNAPLYDGSNNLLTLSTSYSSSFRAPVTSYGDRGGVAGALVSLKSVYLDGSSAMGRLPTFSGNTTSTYPYEGLLSFGVNKVTISYTELVAAALDDRIQTHVIPAKSKITNVIADVTTPFAGLAGTITLGLGDGTTTETEYLLNFDVKTAAVTKGLVDADLGVKLSRANSVQGGIFYWANSIVHAHFISGTGNFGNGTVTNLSAGSVDIYITVERMP